MTDRTAPCRGRRASVKLDDRRNCAIMDALESRVRPGRSLRWLCAARYPIASRSSPRRGTALWQTRPPRDRAALPQHSCGGDDLIRRGQFPHPGRPFGCALNVGPAHDTVTVDQELALKLWPLPLHVRFIRIVFGVAIRLGHGFGNLRDWEGLGKIAERVDADRLECLNELGCGGRLRQPVRTVGRKLRIGGKSQARRAEFEIQSCVLRRGGDDPERLNAPYLELPLDCADLSNLAAAEGAPQPDQESKEQRTAPVIIGQGDRLASVDRRQREGGCGLARRQRLSYSG